MVDTWPSHSITRRPSALKNGSSSVMRSPRSPLVMRLIWPSSWAMATAILLFFTVATRCNIKLCKLLVRVAGDDDDSSMFNHSNRKSADNAVSTAGVNPAGGGAVSLAASLTGKGAHAAAFSGWRLAVESLNHSGFTHFNCHTRPFGMSSPQRDTALGLMPRISASAFDDFARSMAVCFFMPIL